MKDVEKWQKKRIILSAIITFLSIININIVLIKGKFFEGMMLYLAPRNHGFKRFINLG